MLVILLFAILSTFRYLCRFSAEQQAEKDVAPANSESAAIVQTTPGGGDDPAAM